MIVMMLMMMMMMITNTMTMTMILKTNWLNTEQAPSFLFPLFFHLSRLNPKLHMVMIMMMVMIMTVIMINDHECDHDCDHGGDDHDFQKKELAVEHSCETHQQFYLLADQMECL